MTRRKARQTAGCLVPTHIDCVNASALSVARGGVFSVATAFLILASEPAAAAEPGFELTSPVSAAHFRPEAQPAPGAVEHPPHSAEPERLSGTSSSRASRQDPYAAYARDQAVRSGGTVSPTPVASGNRGGYRTQQRHYQQGGTQPRNLPQNVIRGLVFLSSEQQVQQAGLQKVNYIEVSNIHPAFLTTERKAGRVQLSGPWFLEDKFRTQVASHIGEPLEIDNLRAVLEETVTASREAGYPVVDVYLPEQDITTGVVQVIVQVSQLGEVHVEGNEHFTDEQIAGEVRLRPGQPINDTLLNEDLDWLNRNPFRRVDVIYSEGKRPGSTDITLRTEDRNPVRLFGAVSNAGNQLTGMHRYSAGVTWGNALWMDHQLNYVYTRSRKVKNLQTHYVDYSLPVFNRDSLKFTGVYSKVAMDNVLGIVDVEGSGTQIQVRYETELPKMKFLPSVSHQLGVGFDYKRAEVDMSFDQVSVYNNAPEVAQATLSYTANRPDDYGDTYLRLEVFGSPGGIVKNSRDSVYTDARTGAESTYGYARAKLERTLFLPEDFVFKAGVNAQFASQRLLQSEQKGLGGSDSIRGYGEGAVYADRGYHVNLELASPGFSVLDSLAGTELSDQMQLFAFYDWGKLNAIDATRYGEVKTSLLESVGWGLRYEIAPWFTASLSHGIPLRPTKDILGHRTNQEHRLHFNLSIGY